MNYTDDMNREEVRKRARAAGFPPPSFSDDGFATITILMDSSPVPSGRALDIQVGGARVTKEELVAWQGQGTDPEVAIFLNTALGAKYEGAAVWKWRTGMRPIPGRVAEVIRANPKVKWEGSNKPKWAHGVEKPAVKAARKRKA